MRRLCVFCGSKHGAQMAYTAAARKLGTVLADRGIGLVYGGGDVGLMGEVAESALGAGGEVVGVIPRFMVDREVANHAVTELVVVESMHERKAEMTRRADAFLALPGGWGTLEELFEVTTWAQLGLHHKPVGILDVGGFFDPLVSFLDRATDEGFIKPQHRRLLHVGADASRLLDQLAEAAPAEGSKWDEGDKA
ncbi:MAG: TIGR00730 family Rossman fold protein [Acidimicrobiia bacterium]|nr:TIGR00730 family Rossman fold protein [Acidimicrobiia bacterium]